MAVRRLPRWIGELSERGGQLVDIVALKRAGDPAIDAGFSVPCFAAWAAVRPIMSAHNRAFLRTVEWLEV
jgi:hypothetical protein